MSRSHNNPGRVTAKGTRPAGYETEVGHKPVAAPPSAAWIPILMGVLFFSGIAVIFSNYLEFLPGSPDNYWLLGGLGAVLAGIITATQWR
ncbi:MAG: cell division protein CrgA [Actinobacteria bacterium]|nr:cell division protein CrgA [Actinomycetota bacterium]